MVIGETGPHVDLAVIGGGPAGYAAAIRGAELGLDVALIERGPLGGVCLNAGCVPSKALIEASRLVDRARKGERLGIRATVDVDWPAMQAWKAGVVGQLTSGVAGLLRNHKVLVVQGAARFSTPRRLAVESNEGLQFVDFKDVIIATGVSPAGAFGLALDGTGVISAEQAVSLPALPASMAIIGADYAGVELAAVFARLGVAVTVVEPGPRILAEIPATIASIVSRGTKALGVEIRTSVTAVEQTEGGLRGDSSGETWTATAEIIVCSGRGVATVDAISAGVVGVRVGDDGLLAVDAQQRAGDHVYAAGDITPGLRLAHRGYAGARVAAEVVAGQRSAFDATVVPLALFTEPEALSAGITEADAKTRGVDATTSRFPVAASGRALTLSGDAGFLEVVSEKGSGVVLGIHGAGPRLTELAGEAALAIEMSATLDDLALTLHPHPTMSEMIVEAAWLGTGAPLHVFRASPGA